MKSAEVKIKEVKQKGEMAMENEKLSEVIQGINQMIFNSKKNTFETESGEKKEVGPVVSLPPKFSYSLMKHLSRLKGVASLRKDIVDGLTEEAREKFPINEKRYAEDKDYAERMNSLYNNYVTGHEKFKAFKSDTTEVKFDPIHLSEEKQSEYDPDGKFDPTWVPMALIDTLFIFE